MNRRDFKKKLAAVAMTSPILWSNQFFEMNSELLFPNAIAKGDTIGLLAPAYFRKIAKSSEQCEFIRLQS